MKITTVRYRRLQSHDRGYGHDAIEVEAQVEEGETAETAMEGLKVWVHGQLEHQKKLRDLCETVESIGHRVVAEERTLERLKREVADNNAIIKQHDKLVELANANGLGELVQALDQIPF